MTFAITKTTRKGLATLGLAAAAVAGMHGVAALKINEDRE